MAELIMSTNITGKISWPRDNGRKTRNRRFYQSVYEQRTAILHGSMLAVDPASGGTSMPGYSVWRDGHLDEAGTIDIPKGLPPHLRLHELQTCLLADFPAVDLLGIEMLRGSMVPYSLWWACGATIASIKCAELIEIPIMVWKAVAKQLTVYEKGDDADAVVLGMTLIECAKHLEKHGFDRKGFPKLA